MKKIFGIVLGCLVCLTAQAQSSLEPALNVTPPDARAPDGGAPAVFATVVWSGQSTYLLDDSLSDIGNFPVPVGNPNGVTTDGALIYAGFFTTQEVIAFDLSGVEQFRWSGTFPNLQGMTMVGGELAIQNFSVIQFHDPATGNLIRTIPSLPSNIEGLAFDGTHLWALTNTLTAIDPSNGNVITTIPSPSGGCSFGGTGLTMAADGSLIVACTSGAWFEVDPADGSVTDSGNNGLNMYGLTNLDREVPEQARFLVTKDFSDNNTASVEVTLSCNTGLPLEQTTTIEEGDGVNFVVGDFNQGELNCTVTEGGADGYTASYNDGSVSAVNCSWANLTGGQRACRITNQLDQVDLVVTKDWVSEGPDYPAQLVASVRVQCTNVRINGGPGIGSFVTNRTIIGDGGTTTVSFWPDWNTGSTCNVIEVDLPDGGVETDDSACKGLVLKPGNDAACTIVNTRLFEGIPTLSQYGLAIMALLMLGVGFVGFRRFV